MLRLCSVLQASLGRVINIQDCQVSDWHALCRAATRMNAEMTERVLRAPLSFFHTNPTGRILNRQIVL